MNKIIKVSELHKYYGDLHILKGIDLEIFEREIVSIIGSSGAGKTTLLQIIGTLDKFEKGKVEIDNIDISNMKDKELSEFRNSKIGFVFQFHHLFPEFTALENVCIPAYIANNKQKDAEKKAKELLDYLGLTNRFDHKPNELSGGEQQRVAIARALVNSPKIILADEPTGNLDSLNSEEIFELFVKLKNEFNQTFVVVTHNQKLANNADRIYEINDGKIIK